MTQETSGARRLNKVFILFSFCIFAGAFFVFIGESPKHVFAALAAPVTSPYLYNFNADGTLEETWPVDQSTSPYWWVNSGAYLKMLGGTGHTNEGTLPLTDRWRVIYAANNPTDTDNGAHPQNIFRLVTRNTWQNAQEEAYFKITADNLSASPNRNASNGILFFNRYQDGNNLYYTGIRVDGAAVIKKKQNGAYTTLIYNKIFSGTYDHAKNPNLLPKNTWIGLRSETVNNVNGSVTIRLYLDEGWTGVWQLVAEAVDKGSSPILKTGYGGIRTDFMDVLFENFRFKTL